MQTDKQTACKPLTPPLQVNQFEDGCCYEYPDVSFYKSNIYLQVAKTDDIFLKMPSGTGRDYHSAYLLGDISAGQPIRRQEGLECGSRLEEALKNYASFEASLRNYSNWGGEYTVDDMRVKVHWLLIHRMNLERLRGFDLVRIPDARFVFFRAVSTTTHKRWRFFGPEQTTVTTIVCPGIVQQQIEGTQLWDMYDPDIGGIAENWQPFIPAISDQLSPILSRDKIAYFDWNPKNFVFVGGENRVYYIDSKPTTFAGRHENEHNLKGIRLFFQV